MQQLHQNVSILVLSIISILCESHSLPSKQPLWSWECEDDKCVPVKPNQNSGKLQSLETCNMLCSTGLIWPKPTGKVKLASTAVHVRSDMFHVEIHSSTNTIEEFIKDAFHLFMQDLRQAEVTANADKNVHRITVRFRVDDTGDPNLSIDTDESYTLSVEPANSTVMSLVADIMASSFCGARHALESLSQLIWFDYYLGSLLIIEEALVKDRPKFGYRGLMIDTARNHIPFVELLRVVDGMAASKLNTLHWHASDSQAFSIRFDSAAELTWYGANGPSEFYTTDQVKELVHRARLRGIRVIIEIDVPAHVGHAWNWGQDGFGDLVQCIDDEHWNLYCDHPPCGHLNPLNPHVIEILQIIYSEIMQLTGVRDIFHLGGDDVSKTCWEKHFNGTDIMVMWQDFTRSLLNSIEYVNGKLPNMTLFWSSHLCDNLKSDLSDLSQIVGLQLRNATWTKIGNGVRTIVSHEDVWDLNSGYGAWYKSRGRASYNSWQKFYDHRPWINKGMGFIEGGEATLWSWTVGEGGVDARVWPRAAALAERLWADPAEAATHSVYARLDRYRNRLALKGVRCPPIWSYWCTQNPYTCN